MAECGVMLVNSGVRFGIAHCESSSSCSVIVRVGLQSRIFITSDI